METEFQDFLTLHEAQLVNNGVPSHLWEALHNKVRNEVSMNINFTGAATLINTAFLYSS